MIHFFATSIVEINKNKKYIEILKSKTQDLGY